MRHGKRRTLNTKDIDYALEVLNVAVSFIDTLARLLPSSMI